MDIALLILGVVWGVLNIILFFKLWGACNNIKRIAEKYAPTIKEDKKDFEPLFSTKEDIENWLNGDK